MYQALYRKYRPQTFDEVVGQRNITETLKTQLVTGKLSHAYLFTGSRGTGKTSCAKILAKAVNCQNPVDGNPCNCCSACRNIDSGACMDVLEIDAASNNGVDNVRSLRDDAIYTPSEVKMRVYIIDEVHMLSMSAFNALLKIIEEPPEHLLFILATTELHKVPATILSRCQRFAFRRLMPEDIAGRLNYAAYQEGIDIDDAALRLLARLADGALRDGMSLLDQCASSARGTVTVDTVYRCLGLAGEQSAAQLMQAFARHDSKTALTMFSDLYAQGKDLATMLNELATLARDLLILKAAPGVGGNLISGICTEEEIGALLPQLSSGELLRITNLLQQTTAGFNRSANRRIDAELCIMQLCEPSLSLDAQALNARLARLEDRIASGNFSSAPVLAATPEPEELPPLPDDADAPPAQEPAPQESVSDGFWPELVEKVRGELKPPAMGFFTTSDAAPVSGFLRGQRLILQASTEFIKRMIDKPEILQVVGAKAAAILGRQVIVQVVLQGQNPDNGNDKLQQLLDFGSEHSDIIHINR